MIVCLVLAFVANAKPLWIVCLALGLLWVWMQHRRGVLRQREHWMAFGKGCLIVLALTALLEVLNVMNAGR